MALVVKDASGVNQNLPNSGIDTCYSASDVGSITASNTSATDVYQMVGAAGVVARIRRIEIIGASVIAAQLTTLAAGSTLCRLMRRTAAGTTGAWTALTLAAGLGQFAAASAAASVVVNKAGTTAFTVGAGAQLIRQGYVNYPAFGGDATHNPPNMATSLVWEFGTRGGAPLYLVGGSDYLVINLNGVTPVGTLAINVEWDEATA